MTAPGTVSFKAYLRQKGSSNPKEVRRFGMEQAEVVSFSRLKTKLQQVFPSLAGCSFSVCWKDNDGDDIIISSDDELLTALTETNDQVRRLYLDLSDSASFGFQPFEIKPAFIDIDIPVGFGDADEAESGGEEVADMQGESGKPATGFNFAPKEHFRVICDGCNNKITSHRYKCVECPDFDLCLSCESRGLHSDHIMARIPLANSISLRHPYFMKGLCSLKDAVRKIQHRRKKNERRWSKVASTNDYLYKVANNYLMDWEKCARDGKCDKSEKRGKRDHCHANSSAAQEAGAGASTFQVPPTTENTNTPQPSTSKDQGASEGSCPVAAGLISSLLNKENIGIIQRFLEQISPVPEQILQEVAQSLAGTKLDDESATSSGPKPSTSDSTSPAEPPTMQGPSNSAGPCAPTVSAPMASAPEQSPPTHQSAGSSVVVSPRPGSVEPEVEDWMVVEPQGGESQNTQTAVYPKLPAVEPTPVNVQQPQPQAALITRKDKHVQICLERLERMGYNVDDQFIVELVEANHGDLSRVLDMLG